MVFNDLRANPKRGGHHEHRNIQAGPVSQIRSRVMTFSKLLLLLLAFPFTLLLADEPGKPNIILIISDDQGFCDYGFMGNKDVRTPHLDRLSSQSLVYTRGYVMPVCSPSLACLLTGKLPHAHGITGNDLAKSAAHGNKKDRSPLVKQLLGNSFLLPKSLSDSGYLTFQSGKLWNVSYSDVGFTSGMTSTKGRHGEAGLTIGREGLQPIYDFIDGAQEKKKPFFIWYAPMMPHLPHNAPQEFLSHFQGKGLTKEAEQYYAMVEWFDQTCGELDEFLTRKHLTENTVILYLADNGWDGINAQKGRRAKLSPYELGIRTPMFVRWPGRVTPKRDDEMLASIIDFVPTITKLSGGKLAAGLPGVDLLDRDAMTARKSVFVESYTHDIADLTDPTKSLVTRVVIDGWSKLLVPGKSTPDTSFADAPKATELYDLKADPLEKSDLAKERPKKVARLQGLLKKFRPPSSRTE